MIATLTIHGVSLSYYPEFFGPNQTDWLNEKKFDETSRALHLEVRQEAAGKVCVVDGTQILFKPDWCLVLSKHIEGRLVSVSVHRSFDSQLSLSVTSTLNFDPVIDVIYDLSKPQGGETALRVLEIISR